MDSSTTTCVRLYVLEDIVNQTSYSVVIIGSTEVPGTYIGRHTCIHISLTVLWHAVTSACVVGSHVLASIQQYMVKEVKVCDCDVSYTMIFDQFNKNMAKQLLCTYSVSCRQFELECLSLRSYL